MRGSNENLLGEVFGKLTVIGKEPNESGKAKRWSCKCACGHDLVVSSTSLRSGHTTKCKKCSYVNRSRPNKVGGNQAFNMVYGTYKLSAQRRGLSFELTEDQFRELSQKNCYYCGSSPINVRKHPVKNSTGDFVYNGIDRVDNSIGYKLENCVACCTMCNRMKLNYSLESFHEQVTRIYLNLQNKL